jgi:hypothetical protein
MKALLTGFIFLAATGCATPGNLPISGSKFEVSANNSKQVAHTVSIKGHWVILDGTTIIPLKRLDYIRSFEP